MLNQFSRTELLLGSDGMEKLKNARVAVFGVGGVGGFAVEALARSGVGSIDIIDYDTVCISNINRQIIATRKTVGQYKVDVMKERILDINPDIQVNAHKCFYLPQTQNRFDFKEYSYIVDAVDTVTAKIELVLKAKEAGTPIISSMGAGNKLDPTKFQVSDIYETSVCPLAKVMRRELRKRNVDSLKVVYSKEEPIKPIYSEENIDASKSCSSPTDGDGPSPKRVKAPGSIAFVTSVAGLIIAGETIKDIIRN